MSYQHKSNVDTATAGAPVTVPANTWVHFYSAKVAAGGAAGSIVLTDPDGAARETIGIDAGDEFSFTFPNPPTDRPGRLGTGWTLTFTGTSRYVVVFA